MIILDVQPYEGTLVWGILFSSVGGVLFTLFLVGMKEGWGTFRTILFLFVSVLSFAFGYEELDKESSLYLIEVENYELLEKAGYELTDVIETSERGNDIIIAER